MSGTINVSGIFFLWYAKVTCLVNIVFIVIPLTLLVIFFALLLSFFHQQKMMPFFSPF